MQRTASHAATHSWAPPGLIASATRLCHHTPCLPRRRCGTPAALAAPQCSSGASLSGSGGHDGSAHAAADRDVAQPLTTAPPSAAALQQLVAAKGLDVDAALVVQEALSTWQYLASPAQAGQLPGHVADAQELLQQALLLSELLATGSTTRTLAMLKRHPALLGLAPREVASKVLALKVLLPPADIAQLIYQKPTLLLLDDVPGTVGGALAQLHALMPGIPVEAKLHEGGTVFWSFSTLLNDASASQAAAAAARQAPSKQPLQQQQQQQQQPPMR